jgi:hypothetical protein
MDEAGGRPDGKRRRAMMTRVEGYVRRLGVAECDVLRVSRLIFGGTFGALAALTLHQIAVLAA